MRGIGERAGLTVGLGLVVVAGVCFGSMNFWRLPPRPGPVPDYWPYLPFLSPTFGLLAMLLGVMRPKGHWLWTLICGCAYPLCRLVMVSTGMVEADYADLFDAHRLRRSTDNALFFWGVANTVWAMWGAHLGAGLGALLPQERSGSGRDEDRVG